MIEKLWAKRWLRISVYTWWTGLFFLLSLVWTYPSDAIVEEVSALVRQSGALAHFDAKKASLSGLGVALEGVELVTSSGDPNLPWRIDRLRLGLKSLTTDVAAAAVQFDLQAYGGSASGSAGNGAVALELDGLRLGQVMPLQKLVPVGLSGAAHGTVDLTYDDKGVRSLRGLVDLKLRGAGLGPGNLPIPGFGSSLTLPKASVGDLPIKIGINRGELELEPFKVTGGDVELAGEGSVRLVAGRWQSSNLDLTLDVHATDKLGATQEGKNLLTALDPESPLLPSRIKRSFSKSGWLGVSVNGRLHSPRVQVRRSRVQ